jgi:hypothetical protein
MDKLSKIIYTNKNMIPSSSYKQIEKIKHKSKSKINKKNNNTDNSNINLINNELKDGIYLYINSVLT